MRRIAAAWIDGTIAYGLAVVVIAATDLALGLRLPLEIAFVVLAAALGALALAHCGRSPGKLLCGLRVERIDGTPVTWRRALVREVGGKWLVTLGLPLVIARVFLGKAWVPTVYDLLVAILVGVLAGLVGVTTRSTLHDRIAGTRIVRASRTQRAAVRAVLLVAGSVVVAAAIAAVTWSVRGWIPAKLALYRDPRPIGRYVQYLERARETPIDYVMRQFDRYDVVILAENYHPEATQWELIFELVRDPRFVARVGRVFTEYGYVEDQPALDRLLLTPAPTDEDITRQAVAVMRNIADGPNTGWDNTNFFRYLQRLARFNATQPADRRIRHFFTDRDPGWLQRTREGAAAVERRKSDRDKRMAQTVIDRLSRERGATAPKALVIMNYRHAFAPTELRNAAGYLFAAFPGRTASVLLGPYVVPLVFAPLHGGRWDAAWDAIGNRPVGFDLRGSPFGDDNFDLFPFPGVNGRYVYQDVFTGMVLVTPLRDQYVERGIPGYVDGFEAELVRRAQLLGPELLAKVRDQIAWYRAGMPGARSPHPMFAWQTTVELITLGAFAIGLLWALIALVLLRPLPR